MLEKGPLLRIIERQINGDRTAPTMQRGLSGSEPTSTDPEAWLTGTGRAVEGPGLRQVPDKHPAPAPPGQAARERIPTEWFGYTPTARRRVRPAAAGR